MKPTAMSKFHEGFFSISNEAAFQEFSSISADFWWNNSAQGRSLSFSLSRASFHCKCYLLLPVLSLKGFPVLLSHYNQWQTPHHFSLTALLWTKNLSNFGTEKSVKLLQMMLLYYYM